MDIQVMMPSPAVDFNFNFDSTSTSPFATAPSSPQRFGNLFYSAPTSPTRPSSSTTTSNDGAQSTIPFTWEEKPGVPKHKDDDDENEQDTDFAFDFSGQLEPPSISAADELFDGGKIKPLKPPPRLHLSNDSPRSPKSPKSPKSMFKEALSPRSRKKEFDPFSEALKQTSREQSQTKQNPDHPPQRGRERTPTPTRHKVSRSLSPFRVSDIFSDEENTQKTSTNQSFALTWYNKWNLKNLLLFRSASEGSATTSKDPLKKYATIKKSSNDDVKNSSFRSTDSGCSVGGSTSKRMMRRKVSAHEIHYTANRAVAKEMSRKTSLPYKSGLLGCLGFHHITATGGSVHEISRGISTVTRKRAGEE